MDDELNPSRAEESGYDARFGFRTSSGSGSGSGPGIQGAKKASLENDWESTRSEACNDDKMAKKRKRGRRGGRGAWTL